MLLNRKKIISALIIAIISAIAIFAGYIWGALNWSYAKGERAGYIQKFSRKGWIVKTWEGELQMVPVPGATPEKFAFSVMDDSVAIKINSTMGKKVSLTYEQHKGLPGSYFGETEYFITNVKPLE